MEDCLFILIPKKKEENKFKVYMTTQYAYLTFWSVFFTEK